MSRPGSWERLVEFWIEIRLCLYLSVFLLLVVVAINWTFAFDDMHQRALKAEAAQAARTKEDAS